MTTMTKRDLGHHAECAGKVQAWRCSECGHSLELAQEQETPPECPGCANHPLDARSKRRSDVLDVDTPTATGPAATTGRDIFTPLTCSYKTCPACRGSGATSEFPATACGICDGEGLRPDNALDDGILRLRRTYRVLDATAAVLAGDKLRHGTDSASKRAYSALVAAKSRLFVAESRLMEAREALVDKLDVTLSEVRGAGWEEVPGV